MKSNDAYDIKTSKPVVRTIPPKRIPRIRESIFIDIGGEAQFKDKQIKVIS